MAGVLAAFLADPDDPDDPDVPDDPDEPAVAASVPLDAFDGRDEPESEPASVTSDTFAFRRRPDDPEPEPEPDPEPDPDLDPDDLPPPSWRSGNRLPCLRVLGDPGDDRSRLVVE